MRDPGKKGSHFHPKSDIFSSSEQLDVLTSIACWSVMVALLAGLCFIFGPIPLLKLYGVPYVVSINLLFQRFKCQIFKNVRVLGIISSKNRLINCLICPLI